MTDAIELRFDVTGQTLWFDCPEGRPTSAGTVEVWEDTESDESTVEDAVGAPAIDSVNTTFDAASGVSQEDPTVCYLTATTNIVNGRQYLATNAYGEKEWVTVAAISSGVSVDSRTELAHDYALADTFQGTRISVTIDSDWIADEENLSNPRDPRPRFRATFPYVVGGVSYRGVVFFNVTRYPFKLTVNAQDVDRLSRGFLQRLHPDDVSGAGAELIKEAAKQVRLDLWEHELTDSAFRNNEIINELVRWRSVWLVADAAMFQGAVNVDQVELTKRRYYERFEALVGQAKSRIQATEDGNASVHDRAPIWRR
jgi:hypothetical protein